MDIWAGPLFWPSWHATGLPSVPLFPRSTHVDSTFFGPSSGLALGTRTAMTAKATLTTPLAVPHWILQCTTPPKIRTAAARSILPVARHAFAKTPWLSRVADTYRSRDFRGVGRASCRKRAGSGPHQLQPCNDGDHGDSGLQLVRRNLPCQQAPEHYSGNSA